MKGSFSNVHSWADTTSETEGGEILEVGVDREGFFVSGISWIDPTVGEEGLRVRVLFRVALDCPAIMLGGHNIAKAIKKTYQRLGWTTVPLGNLYPSYSSSLVSS